MFHHNSIYQYILYDNLALHWHWAIKPAEVFQDLIIMGKKFLKKEKKERKYCDYLKKKTQ